MADQETIDTFDELGRFLRVAPRDEAHSQGLWHQVFHVLVVAQRGQGPTVVLQERAASKKTFPSLIDLTATGHLLAGETPFEGVREMAEELGIEANPRDLFPLGVRRLVDDTPEGLNREFVHMFLCRDDRPLSGYAPEPSEVEAVVEVMIQDALSLFNGDRHELTVPRYNGNGHVRQRTITRDSFVPESPTVASSTPGWSYWRSVLIMAERYLHGERHLSI